VDDSEQFAASLLSVASHADLAALPPDADALMVSGLDDQLLAAIVARVPDVRHVISNGSGQVTDDGLRSLAHLSCLESLDLEWSRVTDAGLPSIAGCKSLRWVDLDFCEGVTAEGLAWLREVRPDLEIEPPAT
jgi:hypothetical protein